MTTNPSGPPAGWYDHPTMANTQRYWDGAKWTDQIAPRPAAPAYAPARPYEEYREPPTSLITAGYVLGIIFPIVGFVIGLVLLGKREAGHGVGCIVLSVVAFFVWMSIVTASQPDPYGYIITFRY